MAQAACDRASTVRRTSRVGRGREAPRPPRYHRRPAEPRPFPSLTRPKGTTNDRASEAPENRARPDDAAAPADAPRRRRAAGQGAGGRFRLRRPAALRRPSPRAGERRACASRVPGCRPTTVWLRRMPASPRASSPRDESHASTTLGSPRPRSCTAPRCGPRTPTSPRSRRSTSFTCEAIGFSTARKHPPADPSLDPLRPANHRGRAWILRPPSLWGYG